MEKLKEKVSREKATELLNSEMIEKYQASNKAYDSFNEILNLRIDDLSKNAKESVDQISFLATLLKLRKVDDTFILGQIVELK